MSDKPDKQRQIDAYNRMLEHVRHAQTRAPEQSRPVLAQLVDRAREKIVELEELTVEEAEKIAEYLVRDLHDAAEYLAGDEARELASWFKFDIQLIENRLLELFASVANPTNLELLSLEERAAHGKEFHTGEITALATLRCLQCGQHVHFHTTGHIPPCPKCRHTVFCRA